MDQRVSIAALGGGLGIVLVAVAWLTAPARPPSLPVPPSADGGYPSLFGPGAIGKPLVLITNFVILDGPRPF